MNKKQMMKRIGLGSHTLIRAILEWRMQILIL